jgi:nitroimidazol reductase NimA-like FMN-containing flavoprotein (pyridoxamine 5'-phosphate oxidase superfamily)
LPSAPSPSRIEVGRKMTDRIDVPSGMLGHGGATPPSPAAVALGDAECWRHLRSEDLGRIGVTLDGQPLVFPVNYAVSKESIVFRTAAGTMLHRAPGSLACFEIDRYDRGLRDGWSVMAVGKLDEITDADDSYSQALRGLPVQPLAPGPRPHWIALRVARVSGRQFTSGWIVPGNWLG